MIDTRKRKRRETETETKTETEEGEERETETETDRERAPPLTSLSSLTPIGTPSSIPEPRTSKTPHIIKHVVYVPQRL